MTHVIFIIILLAFGLAAESPRFEASAAPIVAMSDMAWRRPIGVGAVGFIAVSMLLARHQHFVYHQSMNVENHPDVAVSRIAAAIGEPARARMLYCLMDGHARTSTELAVVAEVSPSTASVHLNRLKAEHLVKVLAQGKHRYYSLDGPNVGSALEGLSVLVGGSLEFVPNTPTRLRAARTCYDHMAGTVGVLLHNRFKALRWLSGSSTGGDNAYDLTLAGKMAFENLGVDLAATRTLRRRFAYPCLDWSERQPHIGGALGAGLLKSALKRKWVVQNLDSRALTVTSLGRREMRTRFGVHL
jgi:DNA-binding transcriptional ArsR family regulator